MSVHLEIRLSWKHTCPVCGRVWHYPTTQAVRRNGDFSVQHHMASVHNHEILAGTITWDKAHYPWIRKRR